MDLNAKPNRKRTNALLVYFDEKELAQLREAADRLGLTPTQTIRLLVRNARVSLAGYLPMASDGNQRAE